MIYKVGFRSIDTGRGIIIGYRSARAAHAAVRMAQENPAARTTAEYLEAERL